MEYGLSWILICIGITAVFGILAIAIEWRFAIIALIWVFIIIPMAMMFLFFVYGMLPMTALNAIRHRIIFKEASLVIEFEDLKDDIVEKKEKIIDYKLVQTQKYGSDYLILFFRNPEQGVLWLPFSGFESIEDFKTITSKIRNNIIEENGSIER